MKKSTFQNEILKIINARHSTPQNILGSNYSRKKKTMVIRTFIPKAEEIYVLRNDNNTKQRMRKVHGAGLFEAVFLRTKFIFKYQLIVTDKEGRTNVIHDPYAFSFSIFTESDLSLFFRGIHISIFNKLGAHPVVVQGVAGVNFAVLAPAAQSVSVIGSFNNWDARCHQMRHLNDSGIWEIFVPGICEGELYKYEIRETNGDIFRETDPYAFVLKHHSETESVIYNINGKYEWRDSMWMERRNGAGVSRPFSLYEVDINSWMSMPDRENEFFTYSDLGSILIPYIKRKGFTHISIPHSGDSSSWIFSYYAPDTRFGVPEDFMAFVDACHQNEIGVILDWLPSENAQQLVLFDSTPISYQDDLGNEDTSAQNGKKGSQNYILSNAFFWLENYHIDGFQTSMDVSTDYLDYLKQKHAAFSEIKIIVKGHMSGQLISDVDMQKIIDTCHEDPYAILGPHYMAEKKAVSIRTYVPNADQIFVLQDGNEEIIHKMYKIHPDGLFETIINSDNPGFQYQFHVISKQGDIFHYHDPYSITSSNFTEFDLHLFGQGNHFRIFDKLGAHITVKNGILGVNFAVWAPNAVRVSVVGPFNRWDGRCHQMKLLQNSGIWEIFIPELGEGELYKYEIKTNNHNVFLKIDPFAFYAEVPPKTAGIVYDFHGKHEWRDDKWMQRRSHTNTRELPVSIYEVHLGSWMRNSDNEIFSYRELTGKLIPYVKNMGFTHIELLPIAEHPYDPSWGYQISNFYAPTSRYGRPEDLMAFVDICHQNGIGVILDWVPAHFPKDAHALAWFDGTCLYEYADPRKGEHRDWGTLIFDYGKNEVKNFLVANALFWLENFHFDGLRVDAVASMLYLDYSRKAGEWIPNKYGGNENLEAIEFLKQTNSIVHEKIPGVMMMAEESTAWPGVSKPVELDGLGFDFKWNMGWMHDVLFYMGKDSAHRKYHHNNLTFGILYAFNENFILSLSHDEVVHMKGSLINKMSGDVWQKFANLRLLYSFMYAHPGKKLLFMGGEFGQWNEWNYAAGLDWRLLEREHHKLLQRYIVDLNRLYRSERAFYEVDFKSSGFEWIEADNSEENIIAFVRKGRDPRHCLFFVMNCSYSLRKNYRFGVPFPVFYKELLNSDATGYGGSGNKLQSGGIMAEDIPSHGHEFSLSLTLPPLGALILKPMPADTGKVFESVSIDSWSEMKRPNRKNNKKKRKKKKKELINRKRKKKGYWIKGKRDFRSAH